MRPLELLFEVADLPRYELPGGLAERYGGGIGFTGPTVISNFVASIDGVVAIDSVQNSPSFISGKSEHDRFVMSLLRACAGAALIGANTLRAEPEHRWTPDFLAPELSGEFAELRRGLGLQEAPELVVLSSSGELDPSVPALEGALVITGKVGAREIARRRVPAGEVLQLGQRGDVEPKAAVEALHARGHDVVLSEAGPALTSQLLRDRLLDELFLTISPVFVGRSQTDDRLALADGTDLLPAGPPTATVLSARRGEGHLFLRYELGKSRGDAPRILDRADTA